MAVLAHPSARWAVFLRNHDELTLEMVTDSERDYLWQVFRSVADPNDVLLLQDVADVSKARTWYGSSEMKSVMEKSGVVGSPSIRAAA